MRIYDEVVDKVGDLGIDLRKAAVIAGFAGVFIEKRPVIATGTILVGLALIFGGLYAFHLKNRRREEANQITKETKPKPPSWLVAWQTARPIKKHWPTWKS